METDTMLMISNTPMLIRAPNDSGVTAAILGVLPRVAAVARYAFRHVLFPETRADRVAEAFAVLRAVNRQNQAVWARFRDRLTQGLDLDEYKKVGLSEVRTELSPSLSPGSWDTGRWTDLCRATLGESVDTTAKAELALALLVTNTAAVGDRDRWREQVRTRAKADPRLAAKLALADTLTADPGTDALADAAGRFFELARAGDFRLWANGTARLADHRIALDARLTALRRSDPWPSLQGWVTGATARVRELDRMVRDEQDEVAAAFKTRVKAAAACRNWAPPDVAVWEELSQNYLSTNIRQQLSSDPDAAGLLAEVYYARGLAPQVGRELAYRHANFRLLGYLAADARDEKLAGRIRGYQADLARVMNLVGWEEVE
jgi:hypothetical protein